MPIDLSKCIGETINHVGDLEVSGDIANNVTINIMQGSLTVNGNIGKNVIIIIKFDRKKISTSSAAANQSSNSGFIKIAGHVNRHCKINTTFGDIVIQGNLKKGLFLRTQHSNIKIKNLSNYSNAYTSHGTIAVNNIGELCFINIVHGYLRVNGNIDKKSVLTGLESSFKIQGDLKEEVKFSTTDGNIEIKGHIHAKCNGGLQNSDPENYKKITAPSCDPSVHFSTKGLVTKEINMQSTMFCNYNRKEIFLLYNTTPSPEPAVNIFLSKSNIAFKK